jgi:hypothetical protein
MRAAVFQSHSALRLEQVLKPRMGAAEVKLRVRDHGICDSERPLTDGFERLRRPDGMKTLVDIGD